MTPVCYFFAGGLSVQWGSIDTHRVSPLQSGVFSDPNPFARRVGWNPNIIAQDRSLGFAQASAQLRERPFLCARYSLRLGRGQSCRG